MSVFSDYLRTIQSAMESDPGSNKYQHMNESRTFSKALSFEALNKALPEKQLQPSLQILATLMGRQPDFNQQLGNHPDFAHLKHSNYSETHTIVSLFLDIKGSTNLFRRYRPQTVLIVTNAIQRAAIHLCLIFGGYIHRLQGDGMFVYFGGKSVPTQKAVESALQFAAMFTYFVKTDLKNLFNEQGIETIFTRIGIDLGYDEQVVWAMAGIGEISEITTCSLHTSLACKMQGRAQSNGIVTGDNILAECKGSEDLFVPVCKRTQDENDRYIFQIPEKKFNYTQYDFNWYQFLKRQSFIATDLSGNLQVKQHTPDRPRILTNLAPIATVSKPFSNENR
jgi:adenylate cyclase